MFRRGVDVTNGGLSLVMNSEITVIQNTKSSELSNGLYYMRSFSIVICQTVASEEGKF